MVEKAGEGIGCRTEGTRSTKKQNKKAVPGEEKEKGKNVWGSGERERGSFTSPQSLDLFDGDSFRPKPENAQRTRRKEPKDPENKPE
ncbi:hypothetical protein N7468_007382 [Penicillium chermesinum]|uniref:Uncharacterized protein n=1 Tax=Penicillium chermesinum TaxID=63820 RepID=A0A9W9TKG4_9EURO|nr:uncharacterized protein N7468_007382 [Penicillium chermesinum]KAJ5226157.1 hypothetical protein N7468_007382 [Penicillium chermesinum]